MKTALMTLALAAVLSFGLVGCNKDSKTSGGGNCALCAAGKGGEAVWCEECGHGFVDGKMVECAGCVAAAKTGVACKKCAN